MKQIINILLIILILLPISAHALNIPITNDSMVFEGSPSINYGTDGISYVGNSGGLEYIYFEVPSTPIQYIVITSNYTSDSAIQMSENVVVEQRPYFDTTNSTFNYVCETSWDCNLNYITVYKTTSFNESTITWNNKPVLGDIIYSGYMVERPLFNSINITLDSDNLNQNNTPSSLTTSRLQTCSSTRGYSDIVLPLMGFLLLIVGFGTLFITFKSGFNGNEISGALILSSLLLVIIGFGLIIVGNYLLYAIYNVTC